MVLPLLSPWPDSRDPTDHARVSQELGSSGMVAAAWAHSQSQWPASVSQVVSFLWDSTVSFWLTLFPTIFIAPCPPSAPQDSCDGCSLTPLLHVNLFPAAPAPVCLPPHPWKDLNDPMPRLSFCHWVRCPGRGCHGSWMPDPFVDSPPLALLVTLTLDWQAAPALVPVVPNPQPPLPPALAVGMGGGEGGDL